MKLLVLENGKLKFKIENRQEKRCKFVKKLAKIRELDKEKFFSFLYDEMMNFTNIELLNENLLSINIIEFTKTGYFESHNIIKLNENLISGFHFRDNLYEFLENYKFNKIKIDKEQKRIKNSIISNSEIEMAIIELADYYKRNSDMPNMEESVVSNLREYFNKNFDQVQRIINKEVKLSYVFNKDIIKRLIIDFVLIIICIPVLMYATANFIFKVFNYTIDLDIPIYIFIGVCVYLSVSFNDLKLKTYTSFSKRLLKELNIQADKVQERVKRKYLFNTIYEEDNDEVFFDFLKASKDNTNNNVEKRNYDGLL